MTNLSECQISKAKERRRQKEEAQQNQLNNLEMANIVANYLYLRDKDQAEAEDSRITTIASVQYEKNTQVKDKGQEVLDREQEAHKVQASEAILKNE